MPDPLRLYVDAQFVSPYAMSVYVALHEKQLDFHISAVDLGALEHRAAGFSQLSLTQRVPTLLHGDFALSESSAITEYIDETFAGIALYPRDPQARARARQLQAWLEKNDVVTREVIAIVIREGVGKIVLEQLEFRMRSEFINFGNQLSQKMTGRPLY